MLGADRELARAVNPRAWAAVAIGVAAFAVVAAGVHSGATDAFDRTVLLALRRPDLSMAGPMWVRQAAIEITALGGTTIVFLAAATAGIVLALDRRGRRGVRAAGVLRNRLRADARSQGGFR